MNGHVLAPVGRGTAWVLTGVGRGMVWVCTGLGRGLSVVGRLLGMTLFVWPWVGLWRYVLVPVVRYGIAVPAVWLWRQVLAPLGSALLRYVLAPIALYGVAMPTRWLYRWVLAPVGLGVTWLVVGVGRGLAWGFTRLGRGLALVLTGLGRGLRFCAIGLATVLFVWPWRYVLAPLLRYGIAVPATWLWRRVLVPVGREIRDALAICWRVAGFLSLTVGRALKWVAWNLVGRPVTWAWTHVVRPAGHWVRDSVWAPARRVAVDTGRAVREALAAARASVREARRDAWRALVGGARMTEPREPEVARTRTLGSTTNVPGAAPAPEISLRKRG